MFRAIGEIEELLADKLWDQNQEIHVSANPTINLPFLVICHFALIFQNLVYTSVAFRAYPA
jgi:hypothetical protein